MRLMAELLAASLAIGSGSMLGGCENQYPDSRYPQAQYPQSQYSQGTYAQGQYQHPQTPYSYSPQSTDQNTVPQTYDQDGQQGTILTPDNSQNLPQPVDPQTNQWSPGRQVLGIMASPMTPDLRNYFSAPSDRGVLVAHVAPGSAAERAGLRVGDILLDVSGRPVRSSDDVTSALRSLQQSQIPLTVIRPTIMAATITTVTRPRAVSGGVSMAIAMRRFTAKRFGTWRTPIEFTGKKSPGSERTWWMRPDTGACTRW